MAVRICAGCGNTLNWSGERKPTAHGRFLESLARIDRYGLVPVQSSLPPGLATDRVLRLCAGTHYQPMLLLGRGGMGHIYVVRHLQLEKPFALKMLHPHLIESPHLAERLRIEAQAMARLGHGNVVKVIDFWTDDEGVPCLVMELLEGRNLGAEVFERDRIPAPEVIDWGCQALSALVAAHEIGVVHRDIKPENLFLHQPSGKARVLKVLDFGVARVIEDYSDVTPEALASPTLTGTRIGSRRYMSPEGVRGERVDPRADIYSLGLTLYVALVGSNPFDGGAGEEVVPPSKAGALQSFPELDAIILRAMHRSAESRFQSAKDFLSELSRLAPVRRNRGSWQMRR